MHTDTNKHLNYAALIRRNNILTTIMQTHRSMEGINCFLDIATKKQLARLTDHLHLECFINPTVQSTVFVEHDDITILRKSVQRGVNVKINHVDFMENYTFTEYFRCEIKVCQ
jgi:hypothetical protein